MRIALLASADVPWALQLAGSWVLAGDEVVLVLLDGAVTTSRKGSARAEELARLVGTGASVLAEEHALARRGLDLSALLAGVKVADLDQVADLLLDGSDKAVWL